MKTIAVDFDGVLCSYDGWKGDEIVGEPLPGALDGVANLLRRGFTVVVYSTRPPTVVESWLREHRCLCIVGRSCFCPGVCYTSCVQAVHLSYHLKLFPTRNKAETLALLVALFQRAHAACTMAIAQGEGRRPSTRGMGEFVGRAYRRAYIDYHRTRKAGHTPGYLQAELIDSAEIQRPRKATSFDCWVMLRGTTTSRGY